MRNNIIFVTDRKHCVTDYFLCYVTVCINSVCTYLLFSSSPCILLKVLATRVRRAQGEGVTLRWRTRTGPGGHSCWRVRLLAREYPRVDGHWTSVALHMATSARTDFRSTRIENVNDAFYNFKSYGDESHSRQRDSNRRSYGTPNVTIFIR